ncbi:MAG: hypothetical protein KDA55_23825, partial [Planctomycetales bacterium]|nr:hypothetical protein [Planctomycetales bacterium]
MGNYIFDCDAQTELLKGLERLVGETCERERAAAFEHAQAVCQANAEFAAHQQELVGAFEQRSESIRVEYVTDREAVIYDFESDSYQLVQQHDERMARFDKSRGESLQKAERRWKAAKKASEEQFNAARAAAKKTLAAQRRLGERRHEELLELDGQARQWLRRRRCPTPPGCEIPGGDATLGDATEPPDLDDAGTDPLARFEDAKRQIQEQMRPWIEHGPSRFLDQRWPILIFVFTWLLSFYPVALVFDFDLRL